MLKSLLKKEKIIVAPGTYDALSASIAKQAGFKTLYMTGFGVSGALLAKPDIGLISASEMIARASQIVDAIDQVPLIADGDNGYGGVHEREPTRKGLRKSRRCMHSARRSSHPKTLWSYGKQRSC